MYRITSSLAEAKVVVTEWGQGGSNRATATNTNTASPVAAASSQGELKPGGHTYMYFYVGKAKSNSR